MSRVEIESFLKSFLLFFSSLSLLIASLFYLNYTKDIQTLDETLFSQMRVCSFELECNQFEIDFIDKKEQESYKLYKNTEGLTSYYPIPNSDIFLMSINFDANKYKLSLKELQKDALINFFLILGVIFLLSIVFSFYALYPLRNALVLTQEFIKDILHDFNTPLATLRLNSSMLKEELPKNKKIIRIEHSVNNILELQSHLRSYLFNHSMEQESLDLKELVKARVTIQENNFPDIKFSQDISTQLISVNKEAFSRILDNILTNAAKYNRDKGLVILAYDKTKSTLYISDTGKGIQNPSRVFDRFYKEQERGIGIGLHIVKKLCDELEITVGVSSQINKGSRFTLNLTKLINH